MHKQTTILSLRVTHRAKKNREKPNHAVLRLDSNEKSNTISRIYFAKLISTFWNSQHSWKMFNTRKMVRAFFVYWIALIWASVFFGSTISTGVWNSWLSNLRCLIVGRFSLFFLHYHQSSIKIHIVQWLQQKFRFISPFFHGNDNVNWLKNSSIFFAVVLFWLHRNPNPFC